MSRTLTWALGSGAGGSYTDPASWTDITGGGSTPAADSPMSGDTVEIGGGALITGAVTTISTVRANNGVATFTDALTVGTVMTVSGSGVVTAQNSISVFGDPSVPATLSVKSGGSLDAAGTLTVGGTVLAASGPTGPGPFPGAIFSFPVAASGIAAVNGFGSRLTAAGLALGGSPSETLSGSGTFNVFEGGSALISGPVSVGAAGIGALYLQGFGSTLTIGDGQSPSSVEIGAFASGTVAITNGATLTSQPGQFLVGDGGFGVVFIGGSSGFYDFDSSLSVAAVNDATPALEIGIAKGLPGTNAGTGVVEVNSGTVSAAGAIYVGESGSGTLFVNGIVQVTGTMAAGTAAVDIAHGAGSTGLVSVGQFGTLDAGAGAIVVGNAGAGTLGVGNGSTVRASAAGYGAGTAALVVGSSIGSDGVVLVDGPGTTLAINGGASVGVGGTGTLEVSNGGMVSLGGTNDGGIGLNVAPNGGSSADWVEVLQSTLSVTDNAYFGTGSGLYISGGSVAVGGNLKMAAAYLVMSGGTLAVTGGITLGQRGAFLDGYGVIAASLVNNGVAAVSGTSGGTLEIGGPVRGSGSLALGSAGITLKLDSANLGNSVVFNAGGLGGTATLELASAGTWGMPVAGFQNVDTIILDDAIGATADTAPGSDPGSLTLTLSRGGTVIDTLAFSQTPALFFNPATGVITACFATGTCIATLSGPVPVQHLRPGALVRTAAGGVRPVVWLGHRTLDCARHPRPWDVLPVRVQADAFAPGVPSRDLYLSPDHAVFADGVLVPVRYLLNGGSIAQIDAGTITYWHVELDRHDVLLAEDLPCESYLDTGNRSAFANGGPVAQAHPDFARAIWAEAACAPMVLAGPRLARLRARLRRRLPRLGYRITRNPLLALHADGIALRPDWYGTACRVTLPAGAQRLTLASRTARPADLDPRSTDTRLLGVAVQRLRLDGADIAPDDARFTHGWLPPEPHLRWTGGAAVLDVRGVTRLELRCGGWHRYLARPAPTAAAPARLQAAAGG